MIGAALYLFGSSLRNRARRLARQLRSPRYAIAILVGVLYLGLMFFGQRHGRGSTLAGPGIAAGGTLLLAAVVFKWWLFGADRSALAFTPAEIQFLFPAPLTRAQVLGFKLARNQILILFNALLWTVLFWRGGPRLGAVPHLIGLWLCFSTLSLHRLGAALTRDSILQHGASGWRRAWPAVLVVLVYIGGAALTWQRVDPADDGLLARVEALVTTAPLGWLLYPFRVPLAPLAAEGNSQFLVAVIPALLLAGLHLLWVLRADRGFEDAALEASARRAERLSRWRRGGTVATTQPGAGRRRLPLAAAGPPLTAIIWKNLTRLLRTVSPAFLVIMLVLTGIGIGLGAAERESRGEMITLGGTLALAWAAILSLLGPQWIRADLRGELDQLDQIRTWPLSGTAIMAGMIGSSAVVLTTVQALLGGLGVWALALQHQIPLPVPLLVVLCLAGLFLLGGINIVAFGIQNGAALLYPAWVRTDIRPGGIEQMGQHLLTAGVSFLLLLLFLVGPALVGGGTAYLLHPGLGSWALLVAALLASAGLLLEGFLLVDWLGERFDRGPVSATD